VHSQAEQEVNFLRKFLLGGGGLEAWLGVVNLAVSLCIEDDVRLKIKGHYFLRKKVRESSKL